MIEVVQEHASYMVQVLVRREQSAEEFGALGRSLLSRRAGRKLCVLFDWSGLEGWDDRRAFNLACHAWRSTADGIARAAIVHRPCWNREAALLAALLRLHGAQVRSWPVTDQARARVWLSFYPFACHDLDERKVSEGRSPKRAK